jgi:hypothetical protein
MLNHMLNSLKPQDAAHSFNISEMPGTQPFNPVKPIFHKASEDFSAHQLEMLNLYKNSIRK